MTSPANEPLRLAVLGGGFTGAALVVHALEAAQRPLVIDVVEPAAELGRGAAYTTPDPAHRINVPSDRMSLFSADPTHFSRWLFDNNWLPDRQSTDSLGRHYVPRQAFGAYVGDNLKRSAERLGDRAEVRHRRSSALTLQPDGSGWRVELSDGTSLVADEIALCTGHSPGTPSRISAAARLDPRLIVNPWSPGSLATIQKRDRVLIVGTGLTMADVVATLDQAGHEGAIAAVSRRGLLPREHGLFIDGVDPFDGVAAPGTALELLQLVRDTVRAQDGSLDWQSIVDALRSRLRDMWPALPAEERARVVRRLLPFWEIHRFRISPQAHETIVRRLGSGLLTIERASVTSIDVEGGALTADLQGKAGASVRRSFDSIVLCAGPSRDLRATPLFASLLDGGLAKIDEAGLGLKVDRFSRVIDGGGAPQANLFALGPITRGSFGEMTGAPDIVRQIERIVGLLA